MRRGGEEENGKALLEEFRNERRSGQEATGRSGGGRTGHVGRRGGQRRGRAAGRLGQTRNLRASAKVLAAKGIRNAGHVKPGSAGTAKVSLPCRATRRPPWIQSTSAAPTEREHNETHLFSGRNTTAFPRTSEAFLFAHTRRGGHTHTHTAFRTLGIRSAIRTGVVSPGRGQLPTRTGADRLRVARSTRPVARSADTLQRPSSASRLPRSRSFRERPSARPPRAAARVKMTIRSPAIETRPRRCFDAFDGSSFLNRYVANSFRY